MATSSTASGGVGTMEKAPLDKPALPPIQQRTLTPAEKKKREAAFKAMPRACKKGSLPEVRKAFNAITGGAALSEATDQPALALIDDSLAIACANDRVEIVRYLVAFSADPSRPLGHDALHGVLHAASGAALDVLKYLESELAINVAQPSRRDGSTALHLAAECKGGVAPAACAQTCEWLAQRIDVNVARHRDQMTPLHVAARSGKDKVVRALLNANADPLATCVDISLGSERLTPLALAQRTAASSFFTQDRVTKMLQKATAEASSSATRDDSAHDGSAPSDASDAVTLSRSRSRRKSITGHMSSPGVGPSRPAGEDPAPTTTTSTTDATTDANATAGSHEPPRRTVSAAALAAAGIMNAASAANVAVSSARSNTVSPFNSGGGGGGVGGGGGDGGGGGGDVTAPDADTADTASLASHVRPRSGVADREITSVSSIEVRENRPKSGHDTSTPPQRRRPSLSDALKAEVEAEEALKAARQRAAEAKKLSKALRKDLHRSPSHSTVNPDAVVHRGGEESGSSSSDDDDDDNDDSKNNTFDDEDDGDNGPAGRASATSPVVVVTEDTTTSRASDGGRAPVQSPGGARRRSLSLRYRHEKNSAVSPSITDKTNATDSSRARSAPAGKAAGGGGGGGAGGAQTDAIELGDGDEHISAASVALAAEQRRAAAKSSQVNRRLTRTISDSGHDLRHSEWARKPRTLSVGSTSQLAAQVISPSELTADDGGGRALGVGLDLSASQGTSLDMSLRELELMSETDDASMPHAATLTRERAFLSAPPLNPSHQDTPPPTTTTMSRRNSFTRPRAVHSAGVNPSPVLLASEATFVVHDSRDDDDAQRLTTTSPPMLSREGAFVTDTHMHERVDPTGARPQPSPHLSLPPRSITETATAFINSASEGGSAHSQSAPWFGGSAHSDTHSGGPLMDSVNSAVSLSKVMLEACATCGVQCDIQLCVQCLSVGYCSRACQKADWPKHKRVCRPHTAVSSASGASAASGRSASSGQH